MIVVVSAQVTPPPSDKLRAIFSRGEWDQAVALLERLDPNIAADLFLSLPFEESGNPVPAHLD